MRMAADCTALLMAAECRGSGRMVRTIFSRFRSLSRARALSLFLDVYYCRTSNESAGPWVLRISLAPCYMSPSTAFQP